MKKKKVITIVILILILSCIAVGVFACTERRKKQEEALEKVLIAIEYRRQNGTFPRTSEHDIEEAFYVGYDAIVESEMYVSLAVYNEWNLCLFSIKSLVHHHALLCLAVESRAFHSVHTTLEVLKSSRASLQPGYRH